MALVGFVFPYGIITVESELKMKDYVPEPPPKREADGKDDWMSVVAWILVACGVGLALTAITRWLQS